ncbi:MAG TPA: class I SAM-dependent methyltransferase [Mucilaginibacter sp.]|jgi:ubiquinone/menaquinone biosynthesis C-methylase UbiE
MKKTVWTGERLETHILNNTTIEHLHRYSLAKTFCADKTILDIACGDGYGSNLLAKSALKVIGVDIAGDVIEVAKKKYSRSNLSFIQGSTSDIPLAENSVDVVVSFETIEHHDEHARMMEEIKRVLKPSGLLIISSPDKKNYSEEANYNNPYHVKELYFEEFKQLISQYFINYDFYSQKIVKGSLIINENDKNSFTEYAGTFDEVNEIKDFRPIYHFCLASDSPVQKLENSFFRDDLNQNENLREDTIKLVQQSYRYRLGSIILSPFGFIKKLWYR